jgi:hypothetical protein
MNLPLWQFGKSRVNDGGSRGSYSILAAAPEFTERRLAILRRISDDAAWPPKGKDAYSPVTACWPLDADNWWDHWRNTAKDALPEELSRLYETLRTPLEAMKERIDSLSSDLSKVEEDMEEFKKNLRDAVASGGKGKAQEQAFD